MKNLSVQYNNKKEAIKVLEALEIAGIKWRSGAKPTEWHEYPIPGQFNIIGNKLTYTVGEEWFLKKGRGNDDVSTASSFLSFKPLLIVKFTKEESKEAFEILENDGYDLSACIPTEGAFALFGNKTVLWKCDVNIAKEATKNQIKVVTIKEYKSEEIKIVKEGLSVFAIYGNKKAEARCNPADEFELFEGARLALERLERITRGFCKGDRVVITNNKKTYTTLDPEYFEDIEELRRYRFGTVPREGESGTIKRIGDDGKLYIELDETECAFDEKSIVVVDKKGVERV